MCTLLTAPCPVTKIARPLHVASAAGHQVRASRMPSWWWKVSRWNLGSNLKNSWSSSSSWWRCLSGHLSFGRCLFRSKSPGCGRLLAPSQCGHFLPFQAEGRTSQGLNTRNPYGSLVLDIISRNERCTVLFNLPSNSFLNIVCMHTNHPKWVVFRWDWGRLSSTLPWFDGFYICL